MQFGVDEPMGFPPPDDGRGSTVAEALAALRNNKREGERKCKP